MIELIVNGIPYKNYLNAEITMSVSSLSNDFTFTASAVDVFPPFKNDDSVEVWVNNIKRLTGFIEETNGQESEGSHSVAYSGRDKTGDFIDSQIVGFNDLRASKSLTLKSIINAVIENIGSSLKVIDLVNPEPFNQAEDIIDSVDGTGAFDLVMEYARKRQVLLSSDADGNIVITQSEPTDSGATLQRIKGGDSNNIVSQSWTKRSSNLFNKYIHKGQADPRALNFTSSPDIAASENQDGRITFSNVRQGRQRVIVESKGYSSAQLKNRAKWTSQLAKAKAVTFNCNFKGHLDPNGNEWIENTLVQINSDTADITRKMLLDTLTYSEGEGQPTLTSFVFKEMNVYTIDEKLLSIKPKGKQNKAFWES